MEVKIKSDKKTNGSFLEFSVDTVRLEDGSIATRDFVKHPGAVSIICNVDNKLLCVKQFRYAVNDYTIEIPAGKIEKDEDMKIAINRELIEETGYEANNIKYLGPFIPAPGFSNEIIHMYYADQVVVSTNPNNYTKDADEDTKVLFLSTSELKNLLSSQKLNDLKTAFGFLYFLNMIGEK